MTPLERAARALHTEMGLDWPHAYSDEEMIPLARAVIAAIREPSDAMEMAGYGNTKGDPDNTGIADNPRPDDAWRAMIDALLSQADPSPHSHDGFGEWVP